MGKDHIWNSTRWIQHSWTGKPDPKTLYGQRPYMGFNTVGQENQTQTTIGFNTVGRKTRPRDHIWAKTIYGIQHSGTGKPDPNDHRIQHSWQENQTQRPYMGKDHIWNSTQWDRKTRPKDNRIQHSWDRETRPKDHIWAKTIYGIQHVGFNTVGQGNQTQRPYMGKDHIWDSTQCDKETGPKDNRIQHSWDRETRPKDHIWAKTIYGIQHSWDRETRPKDHIWAKTIYGIQHSGTGKSDPKTIGFNTVGTGKPDSKTTYGIETGPKYHIWDSAHWDRETGPKDHI